MQQGLGSGAAATAAAWLDRGWSFHVLHAQEGMEQELHLTISSRGELGTEIRRMGRCGRGTGTTGEGREQEG